MWEQAQLVSWDSHTRRHPAARAAGTLHGEGGSEEGGGGGGTLGALDLGGSSLEVTFAAEAAPAEDAGE